MQLQEVLPEFKSANATLWAISVDPLDDSRKLSERLKLSIPLASDPELRVIRQFGVEMTDQPIAVPATFVLRAGDGDVVYRYIGETLFDRPAIKAILSAVRQAAGPSKAASPAAAP